MRKNKKGKKLRLNYKGIFKILIFILFIGLIALYFLKLPIKNIYIKGNKNISDNEIIEKAGIKDYPCIFKLNTIKIAKKIKTIPTIKDVKIYRSILGKMTISIKEDDILFYYKPEQVFYTSSATKVDSNNKFLGIPILTNETPNYILKKLVTAFNKVDKDILKMINRIEYNPYRDKNGNVIDETRFKLTMNDTNTVMIDTVNIRKLNSYLDIYVSLNMNETKGLLYLDTITDDNILFESYTSIEQARLEKEQKEAEQNENAEPNNENIETEQEEVVEENTGD